MKRGGGARKGGAFERAICKRLSLWLSDHTRDDILWRTPGSGARHTAQTRRHRGKRVAAQHAGDVQATGDEAVWFVETFLLECKHYASIDWTQVVYARRSANLSQWWNKTKLEASRVGRLPFLIMKSNRQPELLGLSDQGFRLLSQGGEFIPRITVPRLDLVVLDFATTLFLDADKLREVCEEWDEPVRMKFTKKPKRQEDDE